MKIVQLELENIQSYTSETITFEDGETLIYGENAAGKTTLLRAIFGALFQDKSASKIQSGYTLDKLVRKGEDEGRIKLIFEIDDVEYTVEWVLTVTEEGGERKYGGTKKCTLTSPELDSVVEGNKAVREVIIELIGMDATSFVNSVYVQQGDITRLLYATDSERKEILDGLLGLKQIDEKIDRLDEARLGVKDKISAAEALSDDIERRIENELPEKDEVNEQIDNLNRKIDEIDEKISSREEKIEQLMNRKLELKNRKTDISEKQEELKNVSEELEETRNELEKYNNKVESLRSKKEKLREKYTELERKITEEKDNVKIEFTSKDDIESEIQNLSEEKEEIKDKITEKEKRKQKLETEIDHLEKDINDLDKNIERKKSELDDLKNRKVKIENSIQKKQKQLEEKESRIDEIRSSIISECRDLGVLDSEEDREFEDVRARVNERISEINTKIEERKEMIGRADAKRNYVSELQKTGICPICEERHEDLDDKPNKGDVSDEVSELEREISNFESKIDDLEDVNRKIEDGINNRETKEELESEINDKKDEVQKIDVNINDVKDRLGELQNKKQESSEKIDNKKQVVEKIEENIANEREKLEDIEKEIENYENICELLVEYNNIDSKIDSIDDEISNIDKLREKTLSNVSDLEDKEDELKSEISDGEAEKINSKIDSISSDIGERKEEVNELSERKEELRNSVAKKKNIRDQISSERERLQEVKDKVDWFKERKSEILELKESYRKVKRELRKENLVLLNKFTNEVFKELHQGRSIQAIDIDDDYSIDLVKQDNSRISPDMSSGGESNTVNLAIRAGIYKLISEREGKGMLPPFILDEPTQFLDDVHIDELQSFISAIKKWDIPQLLVVSHEDSLIDSANNIIHVEIDRSKGESSISKEHKSTEILGDKDD